LFQKTDRVCFLEMGYSSEPHYKNKFVGAHIDRSWVRNIMEEKGNFSEILMFDGREYDLMFGARDLFVGLKASSVRTIGTPAPIAPAVENKLIQVATTRATELRPAEETGKEKAQRPSTARQPEPENGGQGEAWENVSSALLAYASKEEYSDKVAQLLAQILPRYVNPTLYSKYFRMWEEQGVHLTPVRYDQPIPDTRELTDDVWAKPSQLLGLEMNEAMQLDLLKERFPYYRSEYEALPTAPTAKPYEFHLNNNMFDGTDALVLYCMIRDFKPSRILEVGSGFSSRVSAQAALKNGQTELICIEPYPDDILKKGFPGLTSLITKKVQEIETDYFEELGAGDILFVDSSHVVKIGSDVNYLFLEILPRLKPGVLVHFHDIFLPMEYRRDWVLDKSRFWTEQYLLQAFLSCNSAYEVLLCNSYLGFKHRDEMQTTFPKSPWWGGGSFWMRRKLG
jgi:predicted O-methyltransferase YrrM